MANKLWYTKPANCFEEALPVGNGSIGAMIYGKTKSEKISLNHDCLWSGYPKDKNNPNARESVKKARTLLDKGEYFAAQEELFENALSTWSDAYMPAGNLNIEFENGERFASDYSRSLDLSTAIAQTYYNIDGNEIEAEYFCSFPDKILAGKISSGMGVSCTFSLDTPHPCSVMSYEDSSEIFLKAQMPSHCDPNYAQGENPLVYDIGGNNRAISYGIVLKIVTDARVEVVGRSLKVSNAEDIKIYIKIVTNFEDYRTLPYKSIDKIREHDLFISDQLDYDKIKEAHVKDYQSLFGRCEVNLGDSAFETLPTDDRLKRQTFSHDDNALAVLVFDYGRYLMIASSRVGSKPTNLQGIWNESLTPPWSSNYTTNINAQMNYWPVELIGLPECHMPLMEFTKDLAEKGAKTAYEHYDCRGFCVHHNSDIWAHCTPVGALAKNSGSVRYAFWPMAAGWYALHIWEHYLFTQDENFLKEYYPVIRDAALFFADWIDSDEYGNLTIYPSTSPENAFVINGKEVTVAKNSAMDIGIVRTSLYVCVKAQKVLGIDEDREFLKEIIERMPKYKMGEDGRMLEWDNEYEESDKLHRHISLLFDLYPSNGIKYTYTNLRKACEATLNSRGESSTGWGLAWRINAWARLRNGEKALDFVNQLLRYVDNNTDYSYHSGGGLYANLFDAHPPFQIDGNFGYTAGICEMLLQSHDKVVDILPALPKKWGKGYFKGLRARGAVSVDCEWENGKAVKIVINFLKTGSCTVVYGSENIKVKGVEGESIILNAGLEAI